MIVFIDESGIHKQTGHSTGVVVYLEVENLEDTERRIRKILKRLDIKSFHWAEHSWKVKDKFLKGIFTLSFTFKVAMFKNPVKANKIMTAMFEHLITEKNIKNIFIDGKKPRWYELRLKKILRDKGVSVRKVKTVRNEIAHPGLQLADALAGLTRYHYDKPQAEVAKKWFEKFKKEGRLSVQLIFSTKNPASGGVS